VRSSTHAMNVRAAALRAINSLSGESSAAHTKN
jgi:hypothetical protein